PRRGRPMTPALVRVLRLPAPPRRLLALAPPLLPLLLLVAAGPAAAGGRNAPASSSLDPAVARCVLEEIGRARSGTSARLIHDACEALVGGGDVADAAASPDPSLLVECRVPGGPEWARVRLVTRRQCAAAGGRASAR
ncbi:MAG TPA: hypothetical protein VF606_09960, partial [Geminicoccaceae bacterium]